MNLTAAAAAAAALLLVGGLLDRCTPVVGAHAQLARADAARDLAQRQVKSWAAAFKDSEDKRLAEQTTAQGAMAEAAQACAARVAAARASAARISALVNQEPPRDPQGCPVRRLLDAGELRNALGAR